LLFLIRYSYRSYFFVLLHGESYFHDHDDWLAHTADSIAPPPKKKSKDKSRKKKTKANRENRPSANTIEEEKLTAPSTSHERYDTLTKPKRWGSQHNGI
jgi:hypothetical protein